jgi:hypothetical protein
MLRKQLTLSRLVRRPRKNLRAATSVSTPIAAPGDLMEVVGALIQDLAHSKNARVNAALDLAMPKSTLLSSP